MTTSALIDCLSEIVGTGNLDDDVATESDATHDEALGGRWIAPLAVVRPGSAEEVAAIVGLAASSGVPLVARGSGTGLSGGCTPVEGSVVVSFERMNRIVEIDSANHVAVVEPGVTLKELDDALAHSGLVYPVYPGEQSASIGGTVATNAGGMRAVKYGVTRHHVLGLRAVTGTGETIAAGGRFVKSTSGYDLTQLIVGSEGTLALVTEAILRLHPRADHRSTLLAPFSSIEAIAEAVPPIVASGIGPLLVEYIDLVSMAGITSAAGIDLGIPDDVSDRTLAYLVVVLENRLSARLDEDTEELSQQIADLGALDVYVLPPHAGSDLIAARERAFWASKANGADDLVDVVVPRASIPAYLAAVGDLAAATSSLVVGCGHAGDGNVHLSVWQADPEVRSRLMLDIIGAGVSMGGAVSGEHGIGKIKLPYYAELEDPVKLDLMRRIKGAFDPAGILNPGTIFESHAGAPAGRSQPAGAPGGSEGAPDKGGDAPESKVGAA